MIVHFYDVAMFIPCHLLQISDGGNAVTVGRLWRHPTPLALVGGNCSIQASQTNPCASVLPHPAVMHIQNKFLFQNKVFICVEDSYVSMANIDQSAMC